MLMIIKLLTIFYWDIYTENHAKTEELAWNFKWNGEILDHDIFAEVNSTYRDIPLIGLPDKSCSVEEFAPDADDTLSYGEDQADSSEFIYLSRTHYSDCFWKCPENSRNAFSTTDYD